MTSLRISKIALCLPKREKERFQLIKIFGILMNMLVYDFIFRICKKLHTVNAIILRINAWIPIS